jgi:DNA-binding NarL/FixJ family response regulator
LGAEPPTRVFLCDDVAEMRLLMRLSLEEEPAFEIVGEADNGASALAAIREAKPDVVVVDLAMPLMEGFELIPLIRRLTPVPGIVVYSAFTTPRVEARALACGADRYLRKGAPLECLREVTSEVAGERRRAQISEDPHPSPRRQEAAPPGARSPETRTREERGDAGPSTAIR